MPNQSQKTQGFCVADFATLSDKKRSRSKIFSMFIWIKEPCVRKFEGLERSKRLGISSYICLLFFLIFLDMNVKQQLLPGSKFCDTELR